MRLWITDSKMVRYGGALARSVGNAQSRHIFRVGSLLTLRAGDWFGVGEVCPLPGYSPDLLEDCERALGDIHQSLGPIDSEVSPVEQVAAVVAGLGNKLMGLPSARFAVETAL